MPDPNPKQLFDGEAVIRFDKEVDRRNFLRYAAVVGVGSTLALAGVACSPEDSETNGGGTGTGTTATNRPDESPSPSGDASADVGILNYALTLEFLEADFYRRGLDANVISGRERELIEPIAAHEQAHVDALSQTISRIGGTPVAAPTFTYPEGTFTNKASFLKTASTFEELGVNAYHGQVSLIQSGEILGAAASIAGVESRHAAILATLIDGEPFPAPVEATKTMEQVLAAAQPFIQS
ncbi:MAG: ferritin-like domain-containing protein [Actinomycetota bacterium]